MKLTDRLNSILKEQTTQIKNLSDEINRLESMDFVNRNEILEKRNKELEAEIETIGKDLKKLKEENGNLRNLLSQEMLKQKMDILTLSHSKVMKRFNEFQSLEKQNILNLENRFNNRIDAIRRFTSQKNLNGIKDLEDATNNLQIILDKHVYEQRQSLFNAENSLRRETAEAYNGINLSVSEEDLIRKAKNSSFEFKFGGRITNILGAFLVLLGVVFGLQYTYVNFLTNNFAKSIAAFVIGILFLAAGELLSKKSRSYVSIGITAGGIAILFATTGISYFILQTLSMYTALLICVFITAIAFFLAIRYESQTIANFATVGGFIPVSAISLSNQSIVIALIVYLLILNILTFLISIKREWTSIKYTSFAFNTISMCYIILGGKLSPVLDIVYAISNFTLYIFIVLIFPMRSSKPISKHSFILILINTFVNCSLLFLIMRNSNLEIFYGLCAFSIAMFYFAFGFYLKKRIKDVKIIYIFFSTALAFTILVVPLQFDKYWISLGWLFQSLCLTLIGIINDEKWLKRAGMLIFSLCVAAFMVFDFTSKHDLYFTLKFTAIVLSTLAILVIGISFHSGRWLINFKNFALLFIYLYIVTFILDLNLNEIFTFGILAASSVVYGFILQKLKSIKDAFTDIFSGYLFVSSILMTLLFNYLDVSRDLSKFIFYIFVNILAIFAMWFAVNIIMQRRRTTSEWNVLSSSMLLIVMIIQTLMRKYDLGFNSMIISIVIIFSSLILITYGFWARYSSLRRCGLVFEILAILKFFIIDLLFLSMGQRIFAYFALGLILIGISFVYQHFSKKLGLKQELK